MPFDKFSVKNITELENRKQQQLHHLMDKKFKQNQ